MKMIRRIVPVVIALMLVLALPFSANAASAKYKASKVTAQQIMKELNKTG